MGRYRSTVKNNLQNALRGKQNTTHRDHPSDMDISLDPSEHTVTIQGIPAAPGIVLGKAFVWGEWSKRFRLAHHEVKNDDEAVERFELALRKAADDVGRLRNMVLGGKDPRGREEKLDLIKKAEAFLEDEGFIEGVKLRVREKRSNVAMAIHETIQDFLVGYRNSNDPVLRDRTVEYEFFERFILKNYMNLPDDVLFLPRFEEGEKIILVSTDLDPGEVIQLDPRAVIGIITNKGGPTSHPALVARAMGIPAVVGVERKSEMPATEAIKDGDKLIVDGTRGKVIIHPSRELEQHYLTRIELAGFRHISLRENLRHKPVATLDGKKIRLLANISFADILDSGQMENQEVVIAKDNGAAGIGLARTENLFFGGRAPTTEQLTSLYRTLLEAFHPNPVTIRLLDNLELRGERVAFNTLETNPALGVRGIRFLLQPANVNRYLVPEIAGLMQANHGLGNARLMIPMVTDLSEVLAIRSTMKKIEEQMTIKEIPYAVPVLGIMVETPAAAIFPNQFKGYVDFMSIGTNDLTQYILAADRANEKVGHFFQSMNPAVYWVLKRVISFAVDSAHQIPVEICGELAGDYVAIPLLIGMGLETFSVNPRFVLGNKNLITKLEYEACREMTQELEKELEAGRIRDAARVSRFVITQYSKYAKKLPGYVVQSILDRYLDERIEI